MHICFNFYWVRFAGEGECSLKLVAVRNKREEEPEVDGSERNQT